MNFGENILYGFSLALMMASWKIAEQAKPALAVILGILAWSTLFLPRMFIWPQPEQKNTQWWWLLAGALGLIGVPIAIHIQNKRRR